MFEITAQCKYCKHYQDGDANKENKVGMCRNSASKFLIVSHKDYCDLFKPPIGEFYLKSTKITFQNQIDVAKRIVVDFKVKTFTTNEPAQGLNGGSFDYKITRLVSLYGNENRSDIEIDNAAFCLLNKERD